MITLIVHMLGTFLDLAALSAVIGAAWFIIALSPGRTIPDIIACRMHRFLMVSLMLLLLSSIDNLIQRGVEMSGLGVMSVFPMLPTVIFKSHFGSMWLLRIAGLLSAWTLVIAGRRRAGSRIFGLLLFCSMAMIAFSRSASGHPADFGDLSAQQIADWTHLLAVSCLAGSLLVMAYLSASLKASAESDYTHFIAHLADRYYVLIGPLLAVIVAAGLYNIRVTVGSFQTLTDTTYGRLMSAKLVLLAALAFRIIASPSRGTDEAGYVMKFLRRSRTDALLVGWILIIVSQLVHTIPALHQAHLAQAKEPETQEKEAGQPVVILETAPAKIIAGSPVRMTVSIKDHDNRPLQKLMLSHERILHAIIISRDLGFFAHIHAEDLGMITKEMLETARFPLQFIFPRAGEYLIGFDFAADDKPYSKTVSVLVADAPAMSRPKVDLSLAKSFGDYQVSLELPPGGVRAGTDTLLRFTIRKNNSPVTDLEPYLGASMHLALVSLDSKSFIHVHGEIPGEQHKHHDHLHASAPARFGPEIDATVKLPVKGIYKLFSQVQHKGKVLLFDFMVEVQ